MRRSQGTRLICIAMSLCSPTAILAADHNLTNEPCTQAGETDIWWFQPNHRAMYYCKWDMENNRGTWLYNYCQVIDPNTGTVAAEC